MKLQKQAGKTSEIVYVFIQNATATDGAGLTGLLYNSAGLTAYYVRKGAAPAAITLVTQTVTGAFSSGGFVEVDSVNCPGLYRLDLPDASIADGAESVLVYLKGAANMVPCLLEIQLTAVNFDDVIRGGMTALPNAIQTAAGGIPVKTDLTSPSEIWTNSTRTLTAGTKDIEIDAIKAVTDVIPDAGAMTSIAQELTVSDLNDFNPATDIVAHVTLVDTVTTNTDMRGTDGAVTDLTGISTFDPATDEVITDTASRNASKADVSALALETSVQSAITNISGLQTDITEILGYTNGNWEIDKVNKQMIFKTGADVEIGRFNLFKDGVANSDEPDQRVKV